MIIINSLTKKYGNRTILNNVSINFSTGKVYGIIGKNGAGKTTLFKCIADLETYDGQIKGEKSPIKNHLGLLNTEIYLLEKLTGREYIQLFCNARNIKIDRLDDRNLFNLPLDMYATSYSTGMKKKLALTAILMQENDFFILDEPFNGLDLESNIILIKIIERLKKANKTILISSHILSTLRDICDMIIILENGQFLSPIDRSNFDLVEKEYQKEINEDLNDKLNLFNI